MTTPKLQAEFNRLFYSDELSDLYPNDPSLQASYEREHNFYAGTPMMQDYLAHRPEEWICDDTCLPPRKGMTFRQAFDGLCALSIIVGILTWFVFQ